MFKIKEGKVFYVDKHDLFTPSEKRDET